MKTVRIIIIIMYFQFLSSFHPPPLTYFLDSLPIFFCVGIASLKVFRQMYLHGFFTQKYFALQQELAIFSFHNYIQKSQLPQNTKAVYEFLGKISFCYVHIIRALRVAHNHMSHVLGCLTNGVHC